MQIDELLADFPDDDACLEYLWRTNLSLDGQAARCPRCAIVRRFYRVTGRRAWACETCAHHLYPTAGTIFEGSSTPLRQWFRAVLILAEPKGRTSVSQLARDLNVNYKTALRINRLVRSQLDKGGDGTPLARASHPLEALALHERPMGQVSTVAGSGAPAWDATETAASLAQLNQPYGVAFDSAGTLYISDADSHVVRAVNQLGVIRTIAGSGIPGYHGDGGPAREAWLRNPAGLAFDEHGNLYFTDRGNHVVRRIDVHGEIHTVAGVGIKGQARDGVPATMACLANPYWVLPVAGEVFIADYSGNAIRKVDADGIISTIAGNGSMVTSGDGGYAAFAGVPFPGGLAMDGEGRLYIAQSDDKVPNSRVRRVDPSGVVTTVAGTGTPGFSGDGGPATQARLNNPSGLAFDADGALLIADYFNNRVRRVDPSGTITTVAGTGDAGFGGDGGDASGARLNHPIGIAVDPAGDLFVADSGNHRIRKVRVGTLG